MVLRLYYLCGILNDIITQDFFRNPCFLNMIMTYVLTLVTYYNTIIDTHAHFLFSILWGGGGG